MKWLYWTGGAFLGFCALKSFKMGNYGEGLVLSILSGCCFAAQEKCRNEEQAEKAKEEALKAERLQRERERHERDMGRKWNAAATVAQRPSQSTAARRPARAAYRKASAERPGKSSLIPWLIAGVAVAAFVAWDRSNHSTPPLPQPSFEPPDPVDVMIEQQKRETQKFKDRMRRAREAYE